LVSFKFHWLFVEKNKAILVISNNKLEMKSFIAVVFTAVVALIVPSLASQETLAVEKASQIMKKFFQEADVGETTTLSLRGVETEAASGPLTGFMELWDYGMDSTCSGEVDTMVAFKLNDCTALIDGGYIFTTVTETSQKYTIVTALFQDKKCAKPEGKPQKRTAKKSACKQNIKVTIAKTPSKRLPSTPAGQQGVGLALYHSANACASDHVSKSDMVILQQRNRCVASDHADFVYTACDAQNVYSWEYPSRNGSCSGVAAPTSFPRAIGHCLNSGGFFSSYFCSWAEETPVNMMFISEFLVTGVDAGALTETDKRALAQTYTAAIAECHPAGVALPEVLSTANADEALVRINALIPAASQAKGQELYTTGGAILNALVSTGVFTTALLAQAGAFGAAGLNTASVNSVTVLPPQFI
jgi:hypothetical protein